MGVKKKRVDGGNFKQVAQRCSWLKTDNCYWQLALLLSALLCPSFCRLGFCGDRGSLRQCLISGFVECRAQPDIYRQALSRVTFVNAAYWGDIRSKRARRRRARVAYLRACPVWDRAASNRNPTDRLRPTHVRLAHRLPLPASQLGSLYCAEPGIPTRNGPEFRACAALLTAGVQNPGIHQRQGAASRRSTNSRGSHPLRIGSGHKSSTKRSAQSPQWYHRNVTQPVRGAAANPADEARICWAPACRKTLPAIPRSADLVRSSSSSL